MSQFDHLKKLSASADKVTSYPLYQITDEPELMLVQANSSNKEYFNASLRKNSGSIRRLRGQNFSAGMIDETREVDRELFAKFIIKGWKGVKDSEGKDVVWSKEVCHEFLKALPNYIFDDVRNFASDEANFVDEIIDEEATSGN